MSFFHHLRGPRVIKLVKMKFLFPIPTLRQYLYLQVDENLISLIFVCKPDEVNRNILVATLMLLFELHVEICLYRDIQLSGNMYFNIIYFYT